jgi:hypothetical protein
VKQLNFSSQLQTILASQQLRAAVAKFHGLLFDVSNITPYIFHWQGLPPLQLGKAKAVAYFLTSSL